MTIPVVVALTQVGADLARRVARTLPGAEVHGLKTRVKNADVPFAKTAQHLRGLFESGRPIVAVMATGALVRILAPAISDKREDPPVVALAEDGSVAVPLLGGHHGANDLALTIAKTLGGTAAITNASDTRFGVGLDGDKTAIADALAANRLPIQTLRKLALGLGCERGASAKELLTLADAVLRDAGATKEQLACIATLDVKEDEPAMHAVAEALGVPLRLFTAKELDRETPRVKNPSKVVFKEVGTHSVAEAAALAAAGKRGTLSVAKRKSKRCTAALADSPAVIDADRVGRAPGLLWIVGMGPGAADWRTPEATTAIASATDLVGYSLYLDLLNGLTEGKTRHDYKLGEETERVKQALGLAAKGKTVALISSGDAGIYAMAALVYELIDKNQKWQRLDVRVTPGISALQAAASRLGAPLGHDFCAVSLSDLLTPFEAIEKRLAAAAEGDFVTVFYNPASMKRRAPFERALQIFKAARAKDTPVGLARNLGRADEEVKIVSLAKLTIGMVDMLTTVVIGSSTSREIGSSGGRRMYTPRGYAAKTKTPRKKKK